jgi:hypothetical protein
MKGKCVNGLYVLETSGNDQGTMVNMNKDVAQMVRPVDDINIVHARLGHLNYQMISGMTRANNIQGVGKVNENIIPSICHGCALGKSHREPFTDYSSRVSAGQPLGRIYCDLSGPYRIDSNTGNGPMAGFKYISLIVDEHTRYIEGRLLMFKSDAIQHVKQWIIKSETHVGNKLKRFHTDGGTEYCNKELASWLTERGVEIEITTAHTPQHNGIAERSVRIVKEMIRSMLSHANLDQTYWEVAATTAFKLVNMRATRTTKGVTPYQLWYNEKPRIDVLRVFGCNAYVHVHKDNRRAFDATSIMGVFIGYDNARENAYRIWCVEQKKLYSSRDVLFDETKFTFGRTNNSTSSLSSSAINPDSVIDRVELPVLPIPPLFYDSDEKDSDVLLDNESELRKNRERQSHGGGVDYENKYNDASENDTKDEVDSTTLIHPKSLYTSTYYHPRSRAKIRRK